MVHSSFDCGLGPAFTARRNAALAALLAPLAHRLNNGLATVIGLGELVCARPNAPAVRKLAETVDDQARGVVGLIRVLSSFSKSVEGPPEKIDAAFVLGQVKELLEPVCAAARKTLVYEVPGVLPTKIVPRALLQLAVVRCVEAAQSDATDVAIVVRRDGDEFALEFAGGGEPGLDAGAWRAQGISVDDTASGATTVTVRIPALDAGAPHVVEEQNPAAAGLEVPARSVLVFEQDPQLAELVEAVLSEGGFDVVTAMDVDSVRAATRGRAFDLLLVDEGDEPDHRGESEALLVELARECSLPVGCFGDGSLAAGHGLGPALPKPFRPAELLAFASNRLR